jgi:hypothetical protein
MESSDSQRGEDSHEIAAFMRMFMDMVGISDTESIPAGRPPVQFIIINLSTFSIQQ